jgi:two-component system, NarL family, response regulator NreC
MTIRVLIADDHILLRAGLRALLNSIADFEVVGEASNGDEVQQCIKESRPNVVLMDINMPDYGGIEATRQLQQTYPDVNILMLTAYEDKSLLQEALNAGASGYILKRAQESELTNAIRAVARGDLYVHPAMTRALLLNKEENPAVKPNLIEILTPREIEVLRLLANGHTNREIARMLMISVRTVESHRSNLMSKLNLSSRAALVRYAIKNDLLQGEES